MGKDMTDTRMLSSGAPTPAQVLRHLRRANEVAQRALQLGHHPFGALLVGPDHDTVLIEQGNIDTVNHAESTLARIAATNFTPEVLWGCTLYTSVEPCCMCAGTAYWANIGRIVFGITEEALLGATGKHDENPTMNLPCRQVLAAGQKDIEVIGPVAEIADETLAVHRAFWASR
jgi:tRNA(Arg) A34 adenosine deaminase TadA